MSFLLKILELSPHEATVKWRPEHQEHNEHIQGRAAFLSADTHNQVEQWLRLGLRTSEILKQNKQRIRLAAPSNAELMQRPQLWRDYQLSRADVANVWRDIARESWLLHPSASESVHIWQAMHPEWIFAYQPQSLKDNQHLIIGLQSKEQRELWLKHPDIFQVDSTHGTNNTKVPLLYGHKILIEGMTVTAKANSTCRAYRAVCIQYSLQAWQG